MSLFNCDNASNIIWYRLALSIKQLSLHFFGTFSTGFVPPSGWGDRSTRMPSRESYEVRKEEKSLVQKAKREANQEDMLAAALGMRMGPQKPPATFWQPLKLFAYSQLTSLVRRATLKESDRTPKSEKVHNFKVRPETTYRTLVSCFASRMLLLCHYVWPEGCFSCFSCERWEEKEEEEGGGKQSCFWSVQWAFIKRKSVGWSVEHCC